MTREEAKVWVKLLSLLDLDNKLKSLDVKREHIDILRAYSEGKDIEINTAYYGWINIECPDFDGPKCKYRIKPETKTIWYRNYMTPTGSVGVRVADSYEKLEGQVPIGKNYKWVSNIMCQEIQCD